MNHIDAETLALLALSETEPDDAEQAHLSECASCAGELDALIRTVRAGRGARDSAFVAPPSGVWERIQTELGLPATNAAAVAPAAAEGAPAAPAGADTTSPDSPQNARVTPIGARRRTRLWIPLVAAALVIGLVGGIGVGFWWRGAADVEAGGPTPTDSTAPTTSTGPTDVTPTVIAGAELEPFPAWPGARGSAVVEQLQDGRRLVLVDVDAAADDATPDAPLREVWLIRADGTALVSIGFLDGTSGRFEVPAGVDLAQYPLVDVSAEADNGDPTHSGDSIVRGQLSGV